MFERFNKFCAKYVYKQLLKFNVDACKKHKYKINKNNYELIHRNQKPTIYCNFC